MEVRNAKTVLSTCKTRLAEWKEGVIETVRKKLNERAAVEETECEERPSSVEVCGENEEYIEIKARIRKGGIDRCGNVIQGLSEASFSGKTFGEFEESPEHLGYGPGALIARAIAEPPITRFNPSKLAGRKDYEWKPLKRKNDTPIKKNDLAYVFGPAIDVSRDGVMRMKSVGIVRREPEQPDPFYSSYMGVDFGFLRAPTECEERMMDEYIAQKRKNKLERLGRNVHSHMAVLSRRARSGHTKDSVPPTECNSDHTL
jgi:hypothetical protein